jgi:hypothetical protein
MTETCVSLTSGTLSPDQRVNYAYGMVLGVDEFLTEQQHRLEKGHLHERALHGYGTVYGLHVKAERTLEDLDDVQVTVSTGMLIDQYGREAVITCDQCARLGAWLAAQEQASPGTVASHRRPFGELEVYVVARYASCLDELVPLPGTPCSSSAQSSVASRIRDAWDVDLTFDRPTMPRWESDRRLARLLGSVEIVAGLPQDQSSEDEIIAAVLALRDGLDDLTPDPAPSGSPSMIGLRLPAETAADALDRIFTVWVTQVRPFLEPDLTTPGAPNPSGLEGTDAILLSTIHCLVADPFDPLNPRISSFEPPDDKGRPYLLHTRLIQELRSLREAGQVVVRPQELVTLAPSVDPSGLLTLDAWFHLQRPVSLDSQIEVVTETGVPALFATSPTDPSGSPPEFSEVWRLTAPASFIANDGEQLQARFQTALVFVGDNNTTIQDLEAGGLVLVNSVGGEVLAYTTMEIEPKVTQPPQPPQELVTLAPSVDPGGLLTLDAWFHLPRRVSLPGQIEVVTETGVTAQFATSPTDPSGSPPEFSEVWQLTAPASFIANDGEQLQARFPTALVFVGDNNTTIQDLEAGGLVLANSIDGEVLAYTTMEIEPKVTQPPQPSRSEPSVEFVTITTRAFIDNNRILIALELWFHPQPRGLPDDRRPSRSRSDDVFVTEPAFDIFDELSGAQAPFLTPPAPGRYRNVWIVTTTIEGLEKDEPAYLRVVFRTNRIALSVEVDPSSPSQPSLAEWIKDEEILFVGWDRSDQIIAFARVAGLG